MEATYRRVSERRVMNVDSPKKAAPAKKKESCLRERGANIEEGGGCGGRDEEEVESDMDASSVGFWRNAINLPFG